ncbi:MAG: hypothetical protein AAGD25_21670 [Cyanobacteria bacterium P01_F01_bin.150]
MIEFAQVDVKEIRSEKKRSEFDEKVINELADCILKSSFLVRPVIIQQESFDSYIVLAGHLEYYAAVNAKEKDARRGEMVNAIVIPRKFSGDLTLVLKQIEILTPSASISDVSVGKSSTQSDSNAGEKTSQVSVASSSWITSFENRLSELQSQFQQRTLAVDRQLNSINKKMGDDEVKADLLHMLNTAEENQLVRIFRKIKPLKAAKKLAETVEESRNREENKKFESYRDVAKAVKGFSADAMLDLIQEYYRSN